MFPAELMEVERGEAVSARDPPMCVGTSERDPRYGSDSVLYMFGLRVFKERMRRAAIDLNERGFSATNVPKCLSPDCFTRSELDGFRLAPEL